MKRYKHGALLWFLLRVLAVRSIFAKQLTIDIDLEKPVAITDEKFLSLTIDPATLVRGAALSSDFERSTRLAHALRPAYVRLGGPHGTLFRSGSENPPDNEINRDHLISESDWALVYRWAEKSGLDVIACISAENDGRQGRSLDAEEIVSFSDQMGFNASWQLGYECQNRCNASAADLAKRLVVLRETLNAFPRYANSMIIGPDIVAYETRKERQYLQDYFNGAGNALSAITWHPEFDSISSDSEGVLIQPGDLEKEKKDLYKVIGRFMKNRPLWIAESKPEEYKSLYLGALVLARRLGNAARSNVDVIMRQPEDLTQPSPDYWVSLLHKTLVGRQVFDGHVETDENNHVYLYYQCTKPSSRYEPGSVTIFGVNFNPEDVEIHLKGARVTTLHEYLLSPGFDATNRMFSRSILLNNETLALLNDDVPEMKPIISSNPGGLGISLPSAGIGFWVLPDFKVKSCMEPEPLQAPNPLEDAATIQDQQIKSHVTRSIDKETSRRDRRRSRNNRGRKPFGRRRSKPQRHPQNSGDDTQSLLQEYKNRISFLQRVAGSSNTRSAVKFAIHEILKRASSLIAKVEHATSHGAAREALKDLGLLLTRVPLFELNVAGFQRTKRAKRDLFDEYSLDSEDPLGKGFRQNGVKERRSSQKIKGFVEAVRPRIFDRGGDSEDDSFYGFFGTDPVEGFPTGDVFFETGDYKRSFGGGGDSEIHRGGDPAQDYADPGETVEPWMNDGGDYDFYQPREYFDGGMRDGVEPGELWEDEGSDYGRLRSEDLRRQGDRGSLSRLTGYYEARQPRSFGTREQRTLKFKDPEFFPEFEDLGVRGLRRLKRKGSDLGAVLDQEMIKEDEANSKDCNCRVIRGTDPCICRRKRDVTDAGSNLEIVSEQDATTDNDGIVPEDVEIFSELGDEPMAVLQVEPSNLKIEREAVPEVSQVQETLSEPEVVSTEISEYTESPEELETLEFGDEATTDSALLLDLEEGDLKSSRAVERDGKAFFLSEDGTTEEEKEVDNHEAAESSTASLEDNFPADTIENDEEASGSEIRSATLDPVALFEENVTEIPDDDDEDKLVKGSSKRQADDDGQSDIPANAEEERENSEVGSPKALRPIKKRSRIPISERGKTLTVLPWEKRVMERAKNMLTLKKVADEKRKRKLEESADRVGVPARLRESQIERLRNRLRENRQRLLRLSRRKKPEEGDEEDDEQDKRLDRRETWQTIKDEEILRDAMMMMHEPRREERASETVDDEDDLSATEVVKPRNVRKRFFLPRDRRIFRGPGIVDCSNPRGVQEGIIRLRDVLEKAVRGRVSDDRRGGQSYFALDDSMEDPRFFHYPGGLQDGEDSSEQIIPYPNYDSSEETYDLPRYRPQLESLEILGSSEEYDDSEEGGLASSGEVYMIDPSTYRGGEPTLQLYKQPSRIKNPGKSRIINYDASWEPILYKIQRARQNAYSKREDKIADPESSEIRDAEENAELGALIESLDSSSAAKLSRILLNEDDINKGKQNARSINEGTKTAGEVVQSLESLEDAGESEVSAEEVSKESHQDEQEDSSGSSELVNIRNRRDIYDQSLLTRKQPREIKKTGRDNYVRLEEPPLGSPRDNSAKETVKENEYDEAVPVKEPGSRKRISSKDVKFPNSKELAEDPVERSEDNLNLQQMLLSDQSGLFMVMPWTRSLVRPKREAVVDQEAEQVEEQHLEASTTGIPSSGESDEVEAAMAKKKPPKKYSATGSLFNYLTGKKNLRKGGKEDLPSFIEASIPKMGTVVVDSLQKAQNLTGSVEQLIDDLEERFEDTTSAEEMIDGQSTGMTRHAFNSAITNVKKFFMVLGGIAHALRG